MRQFAVQTGKHNDKQKKREKERIKRITDFGFNNNEKNQTRTPRLFSFRFARSILMVQRISG